MALEAPTLWSNIYITKNYTEETKEAAHINLERSKSAPLFLTWFSMEGQTDAEAEEIIDDLIIPYAHRWQRITLLANGEEVADALHAVMGPLDFQILRDVEISCLSSKLSLSGLTLCRNAPLLRRCRLHHVPSLPSLPSNLVVLDYLLTMLGEEPFSLDPLLDFLPHVAHSLEHLRFGSPTSNISATPRKPKIPLQNLKSLLVKDSHNIMEHILTPNLTYFAASYLFKPDAKKVAEMFHGFSAPKLQSIQFRKIPLLPLLVLHDIPSMFPQLESVMFADCTYESAFVDLLEPSQPKGSSSLQTAANHSPIHRNVGGSFPNLKELAISDMANWTSLQAAIEKRLKNGDKSLRMIHLPKEDETESIMRHLTRWLPKQGIELVLYEPRQLRMPTPPVFQDDFCNEEFRLFHQMMDAADWDDEEDDDYEDYEDFEYWQERFIYGDSDDDEEEEEDIEGDGYYDV